MKVIWLARKLEEIEELEELEELEEKRQITAEKKSTGYIDRWGKKLLESCMDNSWI
jgi:hypothetical protein